MGGIDGYYVVVVGWMCVGYWVVVVVCCYDYYCVVLYCIVDCGLVDWIVCVIVV